MSLPSKEKLSELFNRKGEAMAFMAQNGWFLGSAAALGAIAFVVNPYLGLAALSVPAVYYGGGQVRRGIGKLLDQAPK